MFEPLFLTTRLFGQESTEAPLPVMGNAALYLGALLVLFIWGFLHVAKKGYSVKGPTTTAAKLAEHVFLFLDRLSIGLIGPRGRQYLPLLAALWTIIFVGNVLGLIVHVSPTANLSFNLGMSILTMIYVQYLGIKQNGLGGHLKHFAGPPMAGPLIAINVLLFIVEILSESVKVISLSLRLFGNIAGGAIVIKNLDQLSVVIGQRMLHIPHFHIEWPIGSLLLPIKLLTAIIQPFVWVMLTGVYINAVTHDEHDHPAELGGGHAEPVSTH